MIHGADEEVGWPLRGDERHLPGRPVFGGHEIESDCISRQFEIDAAERGERAMAFFNFVKPAAHLFEVEPVADPDAGVPSRRGGVVVERAVAS